MIAELWSLMRRRKKLPEEKHEAEGPPADFCEWWNPTGVDTTGASLGGHVDAERVYVRKESGRLIRRTYGINAVLAWACARYRNEYEDWVASGRPERRKLTTSHALPTNEQTTRWRMLKESLQRLIKPIPKAQAMDYEPGAGPIEF